MSVPFQSLSISGLLTLDMHALNNEELRAISFRHAWFTLWMEMVSQPLSMRFPAIC